jgi:hypothetical protein
MKQYTTPEQTAKLVELGFEKPKKGYFGLRDLTRILARAADGFISIPFNGQGELIDIYYEAVVKLKEEGVI